MIKLKYRKNQKMSWQYALANNIFFDEEDNDMFSSKKMNGNFYELKRKKLPMYLYKGEFYQFNLSSCIRQQNSLTAQFVSFSLSNLANIFYPPQFLQ